VHGSLKVVNMEVEFTTGNWQGLLLKFVLENGKYIVNKREFHGGKSGIL